MRPGTRIGRKINAVLMKAGFRITSVDRESHLTFAERQLASALVELSFAYNRSFFHRDGTEDPEILKCISEISFTRFGLALFLAEYLRRSLPLDGDVCEFGVADGGSAALLAQVMKPGAKRLWLFDSFRGFSPPTGRDILLRDHRGMSPAGPIEGQLSYPEERVRERLAETGFPPAMTRIVPGFVEETLRGCGPDLPQAVCFAYIDLGLYEPVLATLEFLDPVLRPGGYIVIDDYECYSTGVKTAVDEFLASRAGNYTLETVPRLHGYFAILQRTGTGPG